MPDLCFRTKGDVFLKKCVLKSNLVLDILKSRCHVVMASNLKEKENPYLLTYGALGAALPSELLEQRLSPLRPRRSADGIALSYCLTDPWYLRVTGADVADPVTL